MSRFRHPNIIRVLGFASDATTHCMLLELCDRGTLADAIVAADGMPWMLRLRAALGLAKARHFRNPLRKYSSVCLTSGRMARRLLPSCTENLTSLPCIGT